MGVINNLIEIRRKFRAIVGNNWDGTTLGEYIAKKPFSKITTQPYAAYDSNSIYASLNTNTYLVRLTKVVDGVYTDVTSSQTFSENVAIPIPSVSTLPNGTECVVRFFPAGNLPSDYLVSNKFTINRPTTPQTASVSPKSKGEDIFTESEVDSIDVVKENIEKE